MTAYFLQSLVWSLGGFLLGWTLGRIGRGVIGEPMRPRMSRLRTEHVVGLIVMLLAAVTMVMAVSTNARLERVTQCQAQFNAEYRRAISERTEAANRERDAQRSMLLFILRDPTGATQPALNGYLAALDKADQSRRANPIPKVTSCE